MPTLPTNAADAAKLVLWLAALGAVVIVGARVVGATARKASL